MTSVFRMVRGALLVALIGIGMVARAEAVPIVSIEPASPSVAVGDTVTVDIVAGGLTNPISGFQIILSFEDTVLEGDSFTNDPDGQIAILGDFSLGFLALPGGALDLFVIGSPQPNQPASLPLSRVTFTALVDGFSPITLVAVELFAPTGDVAPNVRNGEVCVGTACTVPEPALLATFAAGLGAWGIRRRRPTLLPHD